MSKYSVNEPELQHARQLLVSMEAELSFQWQRIIQIRNSLYGQQGYGVTDVRNELDIQARVLRTQIENIGRLQECIQYIINCTITASNNAKWELMNEEQDSSSSAYTFALPKGTSRANRAAALASSFSAAGILKTNGVPVTEKEEHEKITLYQMLKQTRKGTSGVQDLLEILDVGELEILDEVLDTPLMKGVGNIALVEKVWKASQEGDFGKLSDMLVKEYGKAKGVKGFEFEAYYTMGKVWGKNFSAYVEKCMTEDITFGDQVSAFWSLTGGMLIETGTEIAYDKLTSIIPWYDDYYGGSVTGFYEKLGEIKDSIVDTYGIKGFGDAIVKVGKNTVSFYGEKLSKLFNWRK